MRIIPAHSMPELQHKMYVGCKADLDNPKSRYNPQVLAPFVIAFAPRPAGNDGVADSYYAYESDVEVGMAAMYVALAAVRVRSNPVPIHPSLCTVHRFSCTCVWAARTPL